MTNEERAARARSGNSVTDKSYRYGYVHGADMMEQRAEFALCASCPQNGDCRRLECERLANFRKYIKEF